MKQGPLFAVLLQLSFVLVSRAQSSAAVALTIDPPGGASIGDRVVLTAVVSPAPPSGKVVFYDTANGVLGTAPVVAGSARLETRFAASHPASLLARFVGGPDTPAAVSQAILYNVRSNPTSSFSPGPTSAIAANPNSTAVGDFNGDHHMDVVVAHENPDTGDVSVTCYLGDGKGRFTQGSGPYRIGASNDLVYLTVGDFNNDGLPDVAAAFAEQATGATVVSLLLGRGAGAFEPHPFSFPRAFPQAIAASDFNGDGNLDLVIAADSAGVLLLTGDGLGGLTELSRLTVSNAEVACAVALGDFDADGNPDLFVGGCGNNGSLVIFRGNGAGRFTRTANLGGSGITAIALGDTNNDGKLDLIRIDESLGHPVAFPFTGNGAGAFQLRNPVALGSRHGSKVISIADFTGDSFLDLLSPGVEAASGNSVLDLLDGSGTGGIDLPFETTDPSAGPQGSRVFLLPPDAQHYSFADFNEDGALDVVIAAGDDDSPGRLETLLGAYGPRLFVNTDSSLLVGQIAVYRIFLQFRGGDPASPQPGIKIVQEFPPGVGVEAASGDGWTCPVTPGAQTVVCTRSDGLLDRDLTVAVRVKGPACPAAASTVSVYLSGPDRVETRTDVAYIQSEVLACVTVAIKTDPLNVSSNATVKLAVTPQPGAEFLANNLEVSTILPSGLVPAESVDSSDWSCASRGSEVRCVLKATGADVSSTSIVIPLAVTAAACPTGFVISTLLRNGSVQDTESVAVDPLGCVTITGQAPFQDALTSGPPKPNRQAIGALFLQATDRHPLSITLLNGNNIVNTQSEPTQFQPGSARSLGLTILTTFPCYGPVPDQFRLRVADASDTNRPPVELKVSFPDVLRPDSISFVQQNGSPAPGGPIARPEAAIPLATPVLSPPQSQSCPAPAVVARKLNPGLDYDFLFDAAKGMLRPGTVEASLGLFAQINNVDIAPLTGAPFLALTVPSRPGVMQSLSLDNRTDSTFQITATGYSTPREKGPTQVCFQFLPAPGAKLTNSAPFCALEQDIAIWYERSASYPTGSQFKGSVAVSLNGSEKAIGQIKAWIKNKEGDGDPMCLDFQSGAVQPCK